MPSSCVVPSCKTGKTKSFINKKISIFKVPRDDGLRKLWEEAIPGVNSLKTSQYVCEKHFEERFIIRRYIKHDNDGNIIADVPYQRPRLHVNTVPTLFGDSVKSSITYKIKKKPVPVPKVAQTIIYISNPAINATEEPITNESKHESEGNNQQATNKDSRYSQISNHSDQKQVTNGNKNFNQNKNCRNNLIRGNLNKQVIKKPVVNTTQNKQDKLYNSSDNNVSHIVKQDHNYAQTIPIKPQELHFISSVYIDDEKITLPKSWGITENDTKFGKRLVFTHTDTQISGNINSIVLAKCITIDFWDGKIRYYVYGRQLDRIHVQQLPEVFNNSKTLISLLMKFQRMHVCEGIGPIDNALIKENDTINSRLNFGYDYNHSQCPLLSKNKKCLLCRKLRKTILQRQNRSLKRTNKPNRIMTKLTMIDYQKLLLIKRKSYRDEKKRLQNYIKIK